jgi:transposase InsO family protein
MHHCVLLWSRDLISEWHDNSLAGHLGVRKVYATLSQHYFWPDMDKDVGEYVRACPECQRTKSTLQPRPEIHPLPVPERPFERISLDWVTGFPQSSYGNNVVLNIIDRFSKWAIIIPCKKSMNATQLADHLFTRVFSWVGFPQEIVGDRDTRLTASQMRKLKRQLNVRLKLSVAYHPQTDGSTERFNRTFLQMLRTTLSTGMHSNWEKNIPALLFAYHNTVHSSTGFTPHTLLFGWTPRDIRAPLAAFNPISKSLPDVESWLLSRRDEFEQAHIARERVRQGLRRDRKASARAHSYEVGDLVKVSTRVLPFRVSPAQTPKLLPLWLGPFKVLEHVGHGAYRLDLPDPYSHTHPVFNVADIRPWLTSDMQVFEQHFPAIPLHPSANPVIQVLDRRRSPGRVPKDLPVEDSPAKYLVLRRDGTQEWISKVHLTQQERWKVVQFETAYPRSTALPCESVVRYDIAEPAGSDMSGTTSPDEVEFDGRQLWQSHV